MLGFCFLLGVPGNIAALVFLLCRFRRDNFTLLLMLSLTCSDLLCLLTLPVWVYALQCAWVFGPWLCKLLSYVVYVSLYASLVTVTLMSVQRLMMVRYPLTWAKVGRATRSALLPCVWTLACVLGRECTFKYASDGEAIARLLSETVLGFVIPFAVMMTAYCWVQQTAIHKTQRLTKLVIFFILWVPVHVVNVLDIVAISLKASHPSVSADLRNLSHFCINIVDSLIFRNSGMNPFLYAFAF